MPTSRPAPLAALLLVCLLAAGCVVEVEGPQGAAPASPQAPAGPQERPQAETGRAEQQMARDVADRVNTERAERGQPPVAWDDALAATARRWSAEMAATGRFEHQDVRALLDSDELSGLVGMGENIFTSSGPVTAGRVHVGWMRSPTHRVNVLNPGWDRLGVGVVCAADGSVWATQHFGRSAGTDRAEVSDDVPPEEPIARPGTDGPGCG